MKNNNKLLVLTLDGFQDHELVVVCSTLERAKTFDEIVFFNPEKEKVLGQHKIVELKTINEINFQDFSAIFIPGGKGATFLRNSKTSLELIQKFKINNKWIFAICDAPNALFENKIIENENYTAFPIPNQSIGKNYQKIQNVVVDNNLITARSASTSEEMALKIIEVLDSESKAKEIHKQLLGI